MYIGEIIKADTANGPGVRLSLFVSGCTNHCEGCFQPETWNFKYGKEYTQEIEDNIIEELSKPYYSGITLLGGDPMEEVNQLGLLPLVERIKSELPDKNIWAYTGFIYDKDLVLRGKRYFDNITDRFLNTIDVLVDGPFKLDEKDIRLKFRGSKNQRIINMSLTREAGYVILSDIM